MANTNGLAIPVTLVEEPTAASLRLASQTGNMTLSDGSLVSPVELFQPFGRLPFGMPGMAVVILNSLPDPLVLTGAWPNAGPVGQTCYPVVSDGISQFEAHSIPAKREHPNKAGQFLYGVGMYSFDSNFFGAVWGAIGFSSGSLPPFAVAWLKVIHQWTAVTADASKYADLEYFYNQTVNASNNVSAQYDIGADATIWGTLGNFQNQAVLMVWVRPALSLT